MIFSRFLQQLQVHLEALYRLDPAPNIADFLVLKKNQRKEQLLVLYEGDLYLRLILDPGISINLQGNYLHRHNLSEFCLAVEGVSHYLFVIFCARQQRLVTLLEVELQGEIDKFVASVLLANRSANLLSQHIYNDLYERFQFVEGLDPVEQNRYQTANALARCYAQNLEQKFIQPHRFSSMIIELREFYRMGYQCKQAFIIR